MVLEFSARVSSESALQTPVQQTAVQQAYGTAHGHPPARGVVWVVWATRPGVHLQSSKNFADSDARSASRAWFPSNTRANWREGLLDAQATKLAFK